MTLASYKDPCDSSLFNSSLVTIFNTNIGNLLIEQFNVLITDDQELNSCVNLTSLNLKSNLVKDLGSIRFLNDQFRDILM